jgi:hypothetical protein
MSNFLEKYKKTQSEQLNALLSQMSDQEKKVSGTTDNRWWKLTLNSKNEGEALIRFLPPKDGELQSYARYFDHSFKGPTNKTYWEKSLKTIGKKDPVIEYNSQLWATNNPEDIAQARAQKARENFVANIYVIKDTGNPENNGKVFLFRFGKQIFDKFKPFLFPDEDLGQKPENPFDLLTGRNFKLKSVPTGTNQEYPNYETSQFAAPSQIVKDVEEIERIYNDIHSLSEFNDPDKFKSYDELKARLEEVLELNTTNSASKQRAAIVERESVSLDKQVEASIEEEDSEFDVDSFLASLPSDND